MTTIGILGSESHRDDLSILVEWAEVVWGVDTAAEAIHRAEAQSVDVLLVDASVVFLTDAVIALVPHAVGRIIAIADTEALREWVEGRLRLESVASFAELRARIDLASHDDFDSEMSGPHHAAAPRKGRVVAVWGPVGAPGATTAAISLAAVCAQSGLRTLLCDADSRGASVAVGLGILDEAPGFAAACRLAARGELTPDEFARVESTSAHTSGSFSVLTGLPRASRWAETGSEKARGVLDAATMLFDAVIVDVGFGVEENEWIDDAPQRDGTTRDVLRKADAVVAIGTGDAVGMIRLIRGLDDISELCRRPILLLNRVTSGMRGDAIDAIRRFTDHVVFATIARDSRGGIEDAHSRAIAHPDEWRRIAREAGLILPAKRGRRWRR